MFEAISKYIKAVPFLTQELYEHVLMNHGYLESTYRHLFLRELDRLGLEDKYFPIQWGGNYSLLYLILRVIQTVKPKNVIELGVGQTTLLIDELRIKAGFEFDVVSLEHDQFWATEMGKQVSHDITHAPLVTKRVSGKKVSCYNLENAPLTDRKFDLMVVDGPIGTIFWSRICALEILKEHSSEEFSVIFDDYQRFGERQSASLIRKHFNANGIGLKKMVYRSSRQQIVLATPGHIGSLYV